MMDVPLGQREWSLPQRRPCRAAKLPTKCAAPTGEGEACFPMTNAAPPNVLIGNEYISMLKPDWTSKTFAFGSSLNNGEERGESHCDLSKQWAVGYAIQQMRWCTRRLRSILWTWIYIKSLFQLTLVVFGYFSLTSAGFWSGTRSKIKNATLSLSGQTLNSQEIRKWQGWVHCE